MMLSFTCSMVSAYNDDYGNSFAYASPVSVNLTFHGAIDYGGDVDCFKFKAPISGEYTITSSGTMDLVGYLYYYDGWEIDYVDDSADGINFELYDDDIQGDQIYLIKVEARNPYTTGDYSIRIDAPYYSSADDHSSTFIGASGILPDTNVVGYRL